MNINKLNVRFGKITSFSSNPLKTTDNNVSAQSSDRIPIYGDSEIRTNPAQLSLFHMHDFHGQNIRMERAYTAVKQFDNNSLQNQNDVFDKNMPIDKLKLCSGDMFLGENINELAVVNEFLNLAGVIANAIGNHECDTNIDDFAANVTGRNYRFLGTNIHPDNDNKINSILSNSLVAEVHGNKYGIIGLVPPDMPKHMKRPDEVKSFKISDINNTIEDVKKDIAILKEQGVNKIIVVSHMGLENDQILAQSVSDIDIILGGHTHNLIKEVKEGENLFYSPKNEPVLIMQVGRDGEFMGIPNIKFNELGQITGIQYNVIKTDEFSRSQIAKNAFENILGKAEVVGKFAEVENPPSDIYAQENPHCDFILDCMKKELDTDIAVMNSANIRGRFNKGNIDTRDLRLISPFANKIAIIEVSEDELVKSINDMISQSMKSPVHRPGIIQVSGLEYTYSKSEGKLVELYYINSEGERTQIDLGNPRKDKLYKLAADDFCIASGSAGLNLKHRLESALIKFDCDKDEIVAEYLRKQTAPQKVKSDGRIKSVD